MADWNFELLQGEYIPRQFEFHPRKEGILFATTAGEVCYVDISTKDIKYVGHIGRTRTDQIISLSWLQQDDKSAFYTGSALGRFTMVTMGEEDEETRIHDLPDFGSGIFCIDVNCDNSKVLVSGDSKDVLLYDIATGSLSETLHNIHTNDINNCRFFHNSPHLLATSSFDKTIKTWDLRAPPTTPLYTINAPSRIITIQIDADDTHLLVSGSRREVNQYLLSDGTHFVRQSLPTQRYYIFHDEEEESEEDQGMDLSRSVFSPCGKKIYTLHCGLESYVHITDAQSGKYLSDLYVYPNNRNDFTLRLQTMRTHAYHHQDALCVLTYYEDLPYRDLVYITPNKHQKHPEDEQREQVEDQEDDEAEGMQDSEKSPQTTRRSTQSLSSSAAACSSFMSPTMMPPGPPVIMKSLEAQIEEKVQHIHTLPQCETMLHTVRHWETTLQCKAQQLRLKQANDHQSLKETLLCAVCQVERKSIVLMPCGHVCLCSACCNTILFSHPHQKKFCPLCNQEILQHLRVYI